MKHFTKALLLGCLLCFLISPALHAQDRTVTGTVSDAETGEPVIGANVVIQGTTRGAITDLDGNYSITAADGDVLQFSYVGYLPAEVTLTGQAEVSIALETDRTNIDELVVIGYGTQKKSDLTGSVTVVDSDELKQSTYQTFDKALQGRAAGVHGTWVTGKPGEVASIKIRGIGSISESSEPLIIVDGMPVGTGFMNSLNPNDIESVQVLKDASATAIYGARGANGVIMITTLKGDAGEPKVNFSANAGVSQIPKQFDLMDASQYARFYRGVYETVGMSQSDPKNMYYRVYSDSARMANGNFDTDTDWQDAVSRVGMNQSYNMSVSGGNEYSNFYIAGNYGWEEGILIDTDMKRYGLTANSDFDIGKRIRIGETFSFTRYSINDDSNYGNGNPFYVSTVTSPLMPIYDSTGLGGYGGPTDTLTGINERTNPVAEQMLNRVNRDRYRILSSVYMDVKLLSSLTYTVRLGGVFRIDRNNIFNPEYTLGNMKLRDRDFSKLEVSNSFTQDLQMNHQLSFQETFGKHSINVVGVWERFSSTNTWNTPVGTDIVNPSLPVLSQANTPFSVTGGINEHRLESYLARVQYSFADKYYITASHRVDGSTRFGPLGGRFGHFPSFSAGWKLNEDLLQSVDEISMLKLRFGWGVTGNENLEDYQYFSLLDPAQNSRYIFGVDQDLYLAQAPTSFQPNPLIKWESAKMTNFGVDLNAFRNRLQVTAEYYIKNQEDMLVNKPISVVFGKKTDYGADFTVGAWANLSKIQNQGFELSASWRKLEGDLKYSVTANMSTLKNRVIDLVVDDIAGDYTITREGHTIGSFYGFIADRIIQESDFDEDGNYLHATQESGTSAGDIKFKDLNQDGRINDFDRTIIGKPLPDLIYGLNINLEYKGLDMVLFLQGMQNMQVYNTMMSHISIASGDNTGKDENKLADVLDYWTPANASTTMTRPTIVDDNLNSRISTWFLYEASFLRIKSLQIGYNFQSAAVSRIGVDQLRVFVNANNLYTLTKYPGYDPEVGSTNPLNAGIDNGFYPVPRSASIGVNLTF